MQKVRLGRAAWIGGLLIAATTAMGQMAGAAERVVKVFNWSDYIDPSILEDFTKETGIKVQYDVFDSNEILETKLLAGKTGYDVVVPSGNFLSRQIQAGVFQKLDKSKLPNLANMWPAITERVGLYDPGNEYAIDYMWGTTGIGFNEGKIKEIMPDAPVDSLDMFFKPEIISKFKKCGIHVLDAPEEIIPIALNYLKLDPNTTNPDDIKKAQALIEAVRAVAEHAREHCILEADVGYALVFVVAHEGREYRHALRALRGAHREGVFSRFRSYARQEPPPPRSTLECRRPFPGRVTRRARSFSEPLSRALAAARRSRARTTRRDRSRCPRRFGAPCRRTRSAPRSRCRRSGRRPW